MCIFQSFQNYIHIFYLNELRILKKLVTVPMPYGKYRGRIITDLPGNYLNWFARKGFSSGELGQLLALMQELDHNGLKCKDSAGCDRCIDAYPL